MDELAEITQETGELQKTGSYLQELADLLKPDNNDPFADLETLSLLAIRPPRKKLHKIALIPVNDPPQWML